MSLLYSTLYTLFIGAVFIFIIIAAYDFLYGEKHEKQTKKIHKYFRNETVKKIDVLERQARKFTMFQVTTNNRVQKIKMKPGYKVIKMVTKEKNKK